MDSYSPTIALAVSTYVPLSLSNYHNVHISLRAVRYCGITFGYTSISILLNYSELNLIYEPHSLLIDKLVTPPSAVGYANGIAQSMASLARCVGPVVGGYVSWSFFLILFY